MENAALYRTWRPRKFGDVVEQEHVVVTLRNSITRGRLAHAYLFCGSRGTGKTTLAQILSRAVNCLSPADGEPCNECALCLDILAGRCVDVVEIDAASNNSVDNIRGLRDDIVYAPAQARRKVYIIDEVHMLSGGAFNALLKTLEEPPEYALFILATTEPHKLPATVLSRCQRFDFRRISGSAIADRLAEVAGSVGARAERDALLLIAKLADGSLRDAISILDQCASAGGAPLTREAVLRIAGHPGDELLLEGSRILAKRDVRAIPAYVAALSDGGGAFPQYAEGMAGTLRNILMMKLGAGRETFYDVADEAYAALAASAEDFDTDYLLAAITEMAALENAVKASRSQSVLVEICLARLCMNRFRSDTAIESLNARVAALEKALADAHAAPPSPQAAASPVSPEIADAHRTAFAAAPAAAQPPAALTAPKVTFTQSAAVPPAAAAANPTAARPAAGGKAAVVPPAADAAPPAGVARELAPPAWAAITAEFKKSGNLRLFSMLNAASAKIVGDSLYVVLADQMAPLAGVLSTPDNLTEIRKAVQARTGEQYRITILSSREAGELDRAADRLRMLTSDNADIITNANAREYNAGTSATPRDAGASDTAPGGGTAPDTVGAAVPVDAPGAPVQDGNSRSMLEIEKIMRERFNIPTKIYP